MSIASHVRSLSLAVLALSACAPLAAAPPDPTARRLVTAALDAMGGEAKLRAIRGLRYKTDDSWANLETPVRPEPPWQLGHSRTETWLDFTRGNWRRASEYLAVDERGGHWQGFTVIAADGATAIDMGGALQPGGPVYLGDAAEEALYHPFRLVLAAADAGDLRRDGGEIVAGQPTEIVAFHHAGWPVRLWLDARTHRLAAAEIVHAMPDDFYWRARGDIRDRFEPTNWTLDASGVWFARQYTLIRNGVAYHTTSLTELEPNAAPAERFAIPDVVRTAYRETAKGPDAATAKGEQPVAEIAPGVWLAAAGWSNALLVAQPAGAVVINAPISERYTGRTLDEVARRFGKPAASVILTDHIVPSLAGVREAAARGVAIRALDGNAAFVDGLLAAPHTLAPDALARTGKHPRVQPVAQRSVVGDGATRIELVPMRTTLGERVLLVYLPAARLLWVASALTVDADGRANASRLAELTAVIAREQLAVERVVGAKLAVTPWSSVRAAP